MNFDVFLDEYWDVFCRHICRFHPLKDQFILQFANDLHWQQLRYNKHIDWNKKLVEPFAFNHPNIYDLDEIRRGEKQPFTLNEEQLLNITETLQEFEVTRKIHFNLYSEYILNHLEGKNISSLFYNRLNYDERFFCLKPLNFDELGYLPQFTIYSLKLNSNSGINTFSDLPTNCLLDDDSKGQGKPRLKEILKMAPQKFASLVVSEKVKSILELFNISQHRFIPLTLEFNKISTEVKYFLFTMPKDTLLNNINFENTSFYYFKEIEKLQKHKRVQIGKGLINSIEHINIFKAENNINVYRIYANEYILKKQLDVFSIDSEIIISERVKNAFDKYISNEVLFESAQLHSIKVESTESNTIDLPDNLLEDIKRHQPVLDKELLFYYDKLDRLKSEKPKFNFDLVKDEFTQIQSELDVIIPESIKERYRFFKDKKRPFYDLSMVEFKQFEIDGIEIEDDQLELLEPNTFYRENGYSSSNPQAYKGIVIAVFDNGDEVGLLLEKNDDFKLQDQIYVFNHESEEIYPFNDEFNHFSLTGKREKEATLTNSVNNGNSEVKKEKRWWQFWK